MTRPARIVLDLRACQERDGGGDAGRAWLELARAVARQASADQRVFVLLDGSAPQHIQALRHAFVGLLEPERIVTCDVPRPLEGDTGSSAAWRSRAAGEIRAAVIESLAPDIVLSSGPPPDGAGSTRFALGGMLWTPDAVSRPGAAVLDLVLATSEEVQRGALAALSIPPEYIVGLRAGEGEAEWDAAAALVLDAVAALCSGRRSSAEDPHARTSSGSAVAAADPSRRPRLAFVSPLPPARSGIADYSSELLPELSVYYDIDVVVQQDDVDDPWVEANLGLRTVEWFDRHAGDYDRVVYQFGNSPYHEHMFGLLARHPGVVVLHEFYLGNVVEYFESVLGHKGSFGRSLYASHGYGALVDRLRGGHGLAAWKYPCNRDLVDRADGVIVHSRYAMCLADRWYGRGRSEDWELVPLCRAAPDPGDREAARERLGLAPQDFLVCCFGILGPTKLDDRLLDAWLESPLAADPHCRLVFVGDAPDTEYCRDFRTRLRREAGDGSVTITGFAPRDLYEDHLVAADLAVQLRAESRGETSAAVLDCLAHGLATLANAHGWAAELPEGAVWSVPDDFSTAALASAFERLRSDPQARAEVAERGREHVRVAHDPARAAARYHEAIERFVADGARPVERRLIRALAGIEASPAPERRDRIDAALCLAANRPARGPRQLLVDITALADVDKKTGIQRVARAVLMRLLEASPEGYRVEPVRQAGGRFVYARRATLALVGVEDVALVDEPIETAPGDVFLGLDLAFESVRLGRPQLAHLRSRGVRLVFVVYDLLPVLRADCFPEAIRSPYLEWLRGVAELADGAACISRTVADELAGWLELQGPRRATPIDVGFFHLGADLEASLPSGGLEPGAQSVLESLRSRPTFLMVGTVEPRKGHAQTVAAFEALWRQGVDVGLVIVGSEGWDTHRLMERLRRHPERGGRLVWLERASDEMLELLYGSAAALLAASEGEGFGLPLVEAAQHRLPVIARDIPVFREVAGEHAFYFSGAAPADLAGGLTEWLALDARGEAPPSHGMPWLTWAESTDDLLAFVLRGRSYSRWTPPV